MISYAKISRVPRPRAWINRAWLISRVPRSLTDILSGHQRGPQEQRAAASMMNR